MTKENAVLELGGRFGTTSCVLAQSTGNSGAVVAVEPDPSVHAQLLRNRDAHNCSFHILRGVVGDTPIALSRKYGHYATQTRLALPGEHSRDVVRSIDVASVERHLGRRFDTLLIDCEGCIEQFFAGSNRALLKECWMCIAAVRNGYMQLLPHAPLVLEFIVYVPDEYPASDHAELWKLKNGSAR